ncbi:MAG: cytochrome C oxidase subunit IV family protein [Acidobacteriia bacterium]|nr:cytochrome C oxidase subunit IV family protein [Terriglobia bacterium]
MGEGAMSEHSTSVGFYVMIFIILLLLTATTVGAAFINLGPLNPVIALGIATTKALLVVLFFMHVKGASEKMIQVVIMMGIFFLLLLLGLALADYGTRLWS